MAVADRRSRRGSRHRFPPEAQTRIRGGARHRSCVAMSAMVILYVSPRPRGLRTSECLLDLALRLRGDNILRRLLWKYVRMLHVVS